jgi:hypothetical protein
MECRSCGFSFVAPPPPVPAAPKILFVSRLFLWLLAWAVAAVVMLIDAHSYWRGIRHFAFFSPPAFIAALITHPKTLSGSSWDLCVVIGWIYYALLTVLGFSVKHYRVFFWLFIALSFSLGLNCILWLIAIYLVSHS